MNLQAVVLVRARAGRCSCCSCNFRLRDSRLGRAWIAIREDEVAAASMGVPLVKTKLLAYARAPRSAAWRARSSARYLNTVNAEQFQFCFSIFVLAMVILGGLGSIWGVVRRRGRRCRSSTPASSRTSFNDVPRKLGLDFDLTAAHVRDLRLPARDHDGPAARRA